MVPSGAVFAMVRGMANEPGRISTTPTPYLIHCPKDGPVYLTQAEYNRQIRKPDSRWQCPECNHEPCDWDDENYEKRTATAPDY